MQVLNLGPIYTLIFFNNFFMKVKPPYKEVPDAEVTRIIL